MAVSNELIDPPAAAEPRTPTSTPQSPGTPIPAHQCRGCRVSFCQPLGCGHVYCNDCLGPPHSLSPGKMGCPECDRSDATPPTPLMPEPKIEHEPEPNPKRTRQPSWLLVGILVSITVLNIVFAVFLIISGILMASDANRVMSTKDR
ncbi:hypothetical protein LZ32DRAFT_648019 [Colletotrichum eremochloae]|nr:hypothetical protein LY78DRAFT_496720 [Colletotrichum sublineola]KAK2012118.1 hypothetical protein LZ32DRAFT_648019 [Colletotrichum eremochloae]